MIYSYTVFSLKAANNNDFVDLLKPFIELNSLLNARSPLSSYYG